MVRDAGDLGAEGQTLYHYRWMITDVRPLELAWVTPMNLEGQVGSPAGVKGGEVVDIVAPFGVDLCVQGGRTVLESLTNEIPEGRLGAGIYEAMRPGDGWGCT
jgi:hypothetical protein